MPPRRAAPSEGDDLAPLSGLQHLVFCERQAALIHVERLWREDGATAEGRIVHERADLPGLDAGPGVRVARAVELRSDALGLVGRADVVEYRADPQAPGGWRPYPVEYKRGAVKSEAADRVQLCAQALCLEEMHGVAVPAGALYYARSHRRVEVAIDPALRDRTAQAARRFRSLLAAAQVPPIPVAPKCRSCSLEPACLPAVTGRPRAASDHVAAILARLRDEP